MGNTTQIPYISSNWTWTCLTSVNLLTVNFGLPVNPLNSMEQPDVWLDNQIYNFINWVSNRQNLGKNFSLQITPQRENWDPVKNPTSDKKNTKFVLFPFWNRIPYNDGKIDFYWTVPSQVRGIFAITFSEDRCLSLPTARWNDLYLLKDQSATSGINLNGHKQKLRWEADQNHQLTWSFESLPRTSLSKNKTKIAFYTFTQGRQKTEQRSYTNLACLGSQSSFCKGCVIRDKRQDRTQQKV